LWFPKIEKLAKDLQNEIGINNLTMSLQSFIVNYYNELSNHINFEEKVLYNFVEKLINGVYVESEKKFVLNHFLETHDHAVTDDITTMKKILLNKDPNILKHKIAIELFEQLGVVENDLKLHGVIEDEVLIDKIHQYIQDSF
jgi:hemerythrin superfamily protein